tara:strand:+ start:126 stop:302 length:177 start_codon:yes stop_codon:yes gene_type:complete
LVHLLFILLQFFKDFADLLVLLLYLQLLGIGGYEVAFTFASAGDWGDGFVGGGELVLA